MKSVLVHAPGSKVAVRDNIDATVTKVCIEGDLVTYSVVWWHEHTRTEAWVQAHEITAEAEQLTIGFK